MPTYAQYFKQEELSDCLLVIRLYDEGPEDVPVPMRRRTVACNVREEELARFPAHRFVLFCCDYFKAQGSGWQTPTPNDQQPGNEPGRPVFSFRIPTAEQLPAAEAVIAALYGVDAAISSLQHAHLVHALILADMLNASEVVQQAASCLEAAVTSDTGLSAAAMETLAGLGVWPRCLQKLLPVIAAHASCCDLDSHDLAAVVAADTNSCLQRMLLTVFRNVSAVLKDPELSSLLIKLPLPAMQLLLASDALKVPSEDIVLYTARQYCQQYKWQHVHLNADRSEEGSDAVAHAEASALHLEVEELCKAASLLSLTVAQLVLYQLVRAPYLTDLALHTAVLSTDSKKDLDGSLHSLLCQLFTLRRFASGAQLNDVIQAKPHMPASWKRGQRQLISNEENSIRMQHSVQDFSVMCNCTAHPDMLASSSSTTRIYTSGESILLGAMQWSISIRCTSTTAGTQLGVYITPEAWAESCKLYIHIKARVVCNATNTDRQGEWSYLLGSKEGGGWSDFWDVGFMANGWDETAWAAKGLPASGDLVVELRELSIS